MSTNRQVEKFRELSARWGLARASVAATMRLIRPWLVLSEVHVRANPSLGPDWMAPEGFEIRQATRAELVQVVPEMPDQLSIAFIDEAFGRGDFCTGAFIGGDVVAFAWSSLSTAPATPDLDITIAPPYRYGYKAYTQPAYRGLRLANALIRYGGHLALQQGRTHSIAYVETRNYASRAHMARTGYKRVGYAGYFCFAGHVMPFRSAGAKAHGFAFHAARETRDEAVALVPDRSGT